MKRKRWWTYCYTISDDAKDFVKTVFENTTFSCKNCNDAVSRKEYFARDGICRKCWCKKQKG